MNLLLLAIAPGIAISLYIYFKDRYNKEPPKYLLVCFLLGVVSAAAAALIEIAASSLFDDYIDSQLPAFLSLIVQAFVVVAFTEEICKYVVLKNMLTETSLRRTVRRHCLRRYGGYGLCDY